jgi:hypothetical protein
MCSANTAWVMKSTPGLAKHAERLSVKYGRSGDLSSEMALETSVLKWLLGEQILGVKNELNRNNVQNYWVFGLFHRSVF